MTDSFAFQISYKLGPTNGDMVNVRGDTPTEFEDHLREMGILVPMIQELGEALRAPGTTGQAVQNLTGAGLNPVPVAQYPPAAPQPAQGYSAPPAPPPAPTAVSPAAQCPACNRNTACPDCGGQTRLDRKDSSRKATSYNAHMCVNNDRHKVVWCKTPIPPGLQSALGNPGLIYG